MYYPQPKNYEPTAADLAFEAFRKKFPYIKCRVVEADEMVYTFPGDPYPMKKEAEAIIEKYNLPLIASASTLIINTVSLRYVPEIAACHAIMKRASHTTLSSAV